MNPGEGGESVQDNSVCLKILVSWIPTTQPKKTRSRSRGQNLHEMWLANGKKKLPIEFNLEGGSFLPIGDNQKLYTRAIGNKVRELLIPCYKDWASIPKEDRHQIFKKVKSIRAQRIHIIRDNKELHAIQSLRITGR
ncbi:hypothetical protein CASFOL_027167 [Castilleja foliolosa]|uniref:Uncharacterized protein n=1 Tax=Castilleja foliolosa TaxID=1961234 RepID=A0ABD3CGH0_9LAMI